jgi:putative N-acetyltransferase (TIGR04045 family)
MTVACDAATAVDSVCVKIATTEHEREEARRLRRDVFCREQGIFKEDDLDIQDRTAMPLVAVCSAAGCAEEVIGTVRIQMAQPGIWHGSRLAVAPHARNTASVGSGLIRLAVGIAHAHGCHTFLAHVQSQNVQLFTRLHWRSLEEVTLHGRPHHLMQADLEHYPPVFDGEAGMALHRRLA